jgi:hypothetical protein
MIRLTKVIRAGMIEVIEHCKDLQSEQAKNAIKWLQQYVDKHQIVGGTITHGGCVYYKRTYKTWVSMIERCVNKSHKAYSLYGGRGITIDDKWFNFEGFFEDMGEAPDGKSLDRIDNDLGYSKENCRWATPVQQARNRRTTAYVVLNGEKISLAEACQRLGIKYSTAKTRLARGYPMDVVLSKKSFMGKRNVGETGELKSAEVIK